MKLVSKLFGKHRGIRRASSRRSVWADREGAAFLYVTVTAASLFAMAALVIDFSRIEITHTAARSAAEAAALAGASQLDGRADAITRATRAAMTVDLVENDENLAQGGPRITIANIRFLDGLPAGDPVLPENSSVLDPFVLNIADPDSPLEARFIEVTTQQLTVNNSFIQAVGGGATATTRATAVAGLTQTICRRAPLAVCNPMENPTDPFGTPGPPMNVANWRGRQVLIKASGPSSSWTPGDFSLVDIDGVQGTSAIWTALAESEPDVCISAIINLKPGQAQGMRTALNTRFDIYENPFGGSQRGNPNIPPARNVVKGKVPVAAGDYCNLVDPAPGSASMALPRDNNSRTSESSAYQAGPPTNGRRFGDGSWNCLNYWTVMHGPLGHPVPAGCTANSTPATMTRFQLYRHEIDAGQIPNNALPGENGQTNAGQMCYTGATVPSDTPERRELYFAVINCIEHGPLNGNSAGDLPVEAFIRGFLTETVSDPPDGPEIFLEIIDIAVPGANDGVLHDIVQLYR